LLLATPNDHPIKKRKQVRLKNLVDVPFIWFPRRSSPVFFDHLVAECARGGLNAPHIVQESADESTLLSLVACGVGVAIVSGASQWRHPPGVSLLRVTDLNLQLPIALIWRVLTYRSGVTLVGAESSPAPRHSGLHKLETSIDNRTLVPILQR
jgi:DNA-binding transcriptional LysR family regulator